MDVLVKWIGTKLGGKPVILCFILAFIACLSQNVVPIHIAFIPLLIPPLLVLFNRMRLDRRAAACALCFGLEAPYIAVPVGFGLIFQGIIADNMTSNGMKATISEVTSVNWILGLAMLAGLAFAILVSYRRKRTYEDLPVAGVEAGAVEHGSGIQYRHWVTLVSLLITVAVQIWLQSLPLAALCGLIVMFAGKAVEFRDIDEQFTKGITMMGYIAFVMLIAGGYALILKETGAVTQLVEGIVPLLGENKILTAFMITLVGLVVTMGIGTSFGTIPIVAVIYVPLCQAMGFSTAATILLISHIFDTCIPTFLHYNIPLMLAAIIGAQFL
jgi:predicted histidine transporter YuiF (NhaC family)